MQCKRTGQLCAVWPEEIAQGGNQAAGGKHQNRKNTLDLCSILLRESYHCNELGAHSDHADPSTWGNTAHIGTDCKRFGAGTMLQREEYSASCHMLIMIKGRAKQVS